MLFDMVDTLQKKRRLLFVAGFVAIDMWLLTLCSQTLQAHRPNITAHIHSYESSSSYEYRGDQFGLYDMSVSVNHAVNRVEVGTLRAVVAITDGLTATKRTLATTGKATLRAMGRGTTIAASTTLRITHSTLVFSWRAETFPLVAVSHGAGYTFRGISGVTDKPLNSIIQPKQDAARPTITPEQIQQASLIQSGTQEVKSTRIAGSGGACDGGAGNGGYPMDWCGAPMDSVRTVSYSPDRINRECTSYAFWYFTQIEGHADFHVTGNANRWPSTSNYPTHQAPAVGAIAVETAGAYGHVAIVQALPGQTYDGKVTPSGYVLVSEMNYDWHGHFRYSYSPLSKFSSYIYP
jgi:hypothetical protein